MPSVFSCAHTHPLPAKAVVPSRKASEGDALIPSAEAIGTSSKAPEDDAYAD